jgi:hypothetical protein
MAPLLVAAFLMFKNETEFSKGSNKPRFADCRQIQIAAWTRTTVKLDLSSTGG